MGKVVIYSKCFEQSFSDFDYLTESKRINEEFGTVIAYKKLSIDTKNFASLNENWIIGTGTFIFKGKKDSDALFEILKSINTNSDKGIVDFINKLRSQIYGSYFLFIKNDDNYYCLVDNIGSYKIYYTLLNNQLFLTNTWYHVAKYTGNNEINEERFIEYLCKVDIVDDCMPIHGVKRLSPEGILVFEKGKWNLESFDYETKPIEKDFWENMRAAYAEIGEVFDKQGIFYTGGQDSRINLALFEGSNNKPVLFYGIGDSRETNTKQTDEVIFNETADKFNLKKQIMNWNDTKLSDLDEFISMLGEYATIYAANKNIFLELKNKIDVDSISFGYFGETLRNNEFVMPEKEISLRKYMELFYLPKTMIESYKHIHNYINNFMNDVKSILQMYNIDSEHIKQNDLTIVIYIMKKNIDTRMCNYVNLFRYSYMLVPNFDLFRMAFSIPYHDKLDSAYILRGINKICPEALDVPLYSHHTLRKINTAELKLKYAANKTEKIRALLINSNLYSLLKRSFVRSLYFYLKGDKKGLNEVKKEKELMQFYWSKIDCKLVKDNFKKHKLELAADGSFVVQMYIILKLLNCIK